MDTNKWKSVLVPREIYLVIKEMSKAEGRTISGQLRVIFDDFVQKYKPRDEDDRFDKWKLKLFYFLYKITYNIYYINFTLN